MPFDAVLFDLDGTVLDTIELILGSYRHTFRAHGLPVPSDERILANLGMPLEACLAPFVDDPAAILAMVETYQAHNHATHDGLVRAYPGIPELLGALEVPSAVVTSKRRAATELGLRIASLSDAFDVLVCADDVANRKPHPEPVLRAVELLGVELDRTLFVGDSTFDLIAGRAAGVRTAGVLWGPFSRDTLAACDPDHLVESVAELREILGVAVP